MLFSHREQLVNKQQDKFSRDSSLFLKVNQVKRQKQIDASPFCPQKGGEGWGKIHPGSLVGSMGKAGSQEEQLAQPSSMQAPGRQGCSTWAATHPKPGPAWFSLFPQRGLRGK